MGQRENYGYVVLIMGGPPWHDNSVLLQNEGVEKKYTPPGVGGRGGGLERGGGGIVTLYIKPHQPTQYQYGPSSRVKDSPWHADQARA